MRIAIIALGTQGDVQPYIALGKGLKEAGNLVRLVTHENFEVLVNSHGLEFWPIKGNVQDVIQSKEMREAIEKGNFLTVTLKMIKQGPQLAIDGAKQGLAACKGMDIVLAGMGGLYLGLSLAEKLGLPFVQAYVVPFTPTEAFPSVLLPQSLSRLGGFFNRLSHNLTRQFVWQPVRSGDTQARQQVLELPAAPFWGSYNADLLHQYPILYGFSPSVIPKPSDWDNNIHVTGYWFLDSVSDWTPPSALIEFLENGPPPVYIGFGSMSNQDPEETADLCLETLARTQQRGIMLSGWGGLHKANLPDTVFMADSIPHSWLFPRVGAIVHHGGAGTTAAGLRAGVPSIIIPFGVDQFFWGERVAELGVGPEPIPRKKLTIKRLTEAVHKAITDQTMRQRAANLGSKIQAEDGIARAVAILQDMEKRGASYR
ncbi:glycosyl transferase, UDP-glucuronosyltransferase [Cylindrospermum stagnale PCC 7417]|uniref:Glycosyl transferase, UDP-glucuronosyltransferase n=1 Tax=Cylindrospermum stagnale PCC 7417 TaxID=56107 RepID=K9WWF8_9NOST|nr:glycosyltransferase [Cylindrospermum stagnale]AFZ24134.1 glycosyl transferase, UDP-glucuronosyltransferase [Cylindrospermum stagnale PCC 7417]